MVRSPSVNFCELTVLPGDLPSTSVNFPCCQKTFRQLSVNTGDLPLTFVNLPCFQYIFLQFTSTFHVARRPSANFCELYMWPEEIPSTFCASGRSAQIFVYFPCGWETFRPLPSTFVPPVTFCQLLSTFRVVGRCCGSFHQLFLRW